MASIFPTGLTYSRNTKDPLQSKIVWNSLSEASSYVNNPDETAYIGMTLAVINDEVAKNNGLWYVEAIGTKSNPTAGVLKKVGSNEVLTAANYTEAVELAKTAPVGTLIKVTASEGSTEESNFHAAGFYIVSVSGVNPSILMLSTTSGEDMDLDAVITALSDLQNVVATKANIADVYTKTQADATFVKDVTVNGAEASIDRSTGIVSIDVSGKVNSSAFDTFKQETTDALATKLESSDLVSALEPYAKTADVVSKTTYDSDKQTIDSSIKALETKVGNNAEGDTQATGLYKLISDTESALRSEITAIPKFKIEVVESLPVDNISVSTVYLVKDKSSVGDLYTEYIYVNGAWENLGKQTVDLSKYSTTEQMNAAISAAIDELKIGDYYKKTEVDGLLNDKADRTDLDNYVQTSALTSELTNYVKTSDFNAYKNEVTQTLGDYVTNTAFTEYQGTVTAALATKVEQSDLEAYVTSESLTNTLKAYVTSESLTNKLADYATTSALTEGLATKADVTSLDSYVLKTAITESTSVSYVGDAIEITSISAEDLNGIMHPVTE